MSSNRRSFVTNHSIRQALFLLGLVLSILLLAGKQPVLAQTTIVVDRNDDTNGVAAQACLDAVANDCSLRGAISKANAAGTHHTIMLLADVYDLTNFSGRGRRQ